MAQKRKEKTFALPERIYNNDTEMYVVRKWNKNFPHSPIGRYVVRDTISLLGNVQREKIYNNILANRVIKPLKSVRRKTPVKAVRKRAIA